MNQEGTIEQPEVAHDEAMATQADTTDNQANSVEVEEAISPEIPFSEVDADILEAVDKSLDVPADNAKPEGEEQTIEDTVENSEPVDAEAPQGEQVDEPITAEKTEEARPSDEFGKLPDNTKKETKERFEVMRTKYDDLHRSHEKVQAELAEQVERSQQWVDTIKSTGTNPEQFSLLMDWARSVNSGTKEGLESGYVMLRETLQEMAKLLGKEAPGFDPLEQHPDLKEELDSGSISRQRALELAEARSAKNIVSAVEQDRRQQADYQQKRDGAMIGLREIGNRIRTNDPFYAGKTKLLEVITETVLRSEQNPEKWPTLIEAAYYKLPNPTPPVASPIIAAVPTPIRPGTNSSGGVNKVAGSIMEAVEASLGYRG